VKVQACDRFAHTPVRPPGGLDRDVTARSTRIGVIVPGRCRNTSTVLNS
jgi:hypothetical protein